MTSEEEESDTQTQTDSRASPTTTSSRLSPRHEKALPRIPVVDNPIQTNSQVIVVSPKDKRLPPLPDPGYESETNTSSSIPMPPAPPPVATRINEPILRNSNSRSHLYAQPKVTAGSSPLAKTLSISMQNLRRQLKEDENSDNSFDDETNNSDFGTPETPKAPVNHSIPDDYENAVRLGWGGVNR
jgi:hypothetical protein